MAQGKSPVFLFLIRSNYEAANSRNVEAESITDSCSLE